MGKGLGYRAVYAALSVLVTAGCTPVGVAVGAGATAGVAAVQERGISGAVDDISIEASINNLWFKHDITLYRKLNLIVYEGRAMVTGFVPTPEMRLDAIRLTWQAEGVKEVINEIRIGDSTSLGVDAKDALTLKSIEAKLLFESGIEDVNYSMEIVDSVVYVIGIAQNRFELERVLDIISTTDGVQHVVSHVRIKSEGV